jgi:hypothetical protein
VVASDERDALGIAEFEKYKQSDRFNGMMASIYVIA